MLIIVVSLLLMVYTNSMLMPIICSTLALIFSIGYSLWLWIKRPKSIIINDWLSNLSSVFTLYFMLVAAIDARNQWWFITPMALLVVFLFIILINNRDQKFDI